jgi:hypothetical protein
MIIKTIAMKFLFTTILVISFFLPCTAQNIVARVEKNTEWSLINEKGEHIIPYLYSHIQPFGDGLAAFRKDGDWGFMDKTGTIIIPAKYRSTVIFASGRAAVCYDIARWKYIDKEGKDVTQRPFTKVRKASDSVFFAQYEDETGFALYNYKGEQLSKTNAYKEVFPFKNRIGIVRVETKTWQYIDVKGKVLYEGEVGFLREFQDGMAMYRKNGLWGYIDSTFKESIPTSFNEAWPFRNGYARVEKSNKRIYIIDKTGKALKYSMLEAGDYSNGLIRVKNNGKWGYINIKGETVIPFIFERAKDFSEGLALVKVEDGYWGYINHKGEWIIEPDLLGGKDVCNGFALVKFTSGLWGFINSKGVVLEGRYHHASKFENVSNENPEEETDLNNDTDE